MSMDQRPSAAPRTNAAGTDESVRLSLADLTDQAGVTVRTVRYYIGEGLLPPPVTAGPQSHYTAGHRDRLQLITRLKDAYLPLREIRRRLAGLDDAAVRQLLDRDPASADHAPSAASDYLDQVLGAPHPRASLFPPLPPPAPREPVPADTNQPEASIDPGPPPQPRPLPIGPSTPLPPPPLDVYERTDEETWRRIRLADDAELLIREASYLRRRDRIDWLIRWARRVFR